jgi:uncharacterized protein YcfJ
MTHTGIPQRLVSSAVIAALVLSTAGCKTSGPAPQTDTSGTGYPSQNTAPAPVQMRADEDRFQKTVMGGVATGALIGGVVGFLGALATGSNTKEAGRTAVAGAVVGGAVGGIDGYMTAKREQAGKNELRAVQAATADVKADNSKLQAFLDSSSTVLNEGKARLAALKGDVAAKRITVAQADAARKREEQNIESMKTTLAQAKKTKEDYAKASTQFQGSAQDKRDLDNEIARMNQQVAKLENNIADYNRAVGVSRAG